MNGDEEPALPSSRSDNINNTKKKMGTAPPVALEPTKLLSLFEKITKTTNSIELQITINNYLKDLTKAEYIFMIPLLQCNEEGLVQVINDQVLEKEIRFSINLADLKKSIIKPKPVECTCQQEAADDVGNEKSFAEVIEMVVGSHSDTLIFRIKNPRSMVNKLHNYNFNDCNNLYDYTLPLKAPPSPSAQQNIVLLVCVQGGESDRANLEYQVQETFKYVTGHLLTSFELFEEKRVRYQCQNLLRVAKHLLGKIGDLGQLLKGVMAEAKNLTNAERCSLFLIDKYTGELVSKVFDGNETSEEVRIEGGKGIAGFVAESGKLLNIRNAYQHPLFFKGVDEVTGFKTRNILCFPICGEEGIIGVAQLCNKLDGFHFDKCDEETATAFSVYCGISIMHALVHRQVQKAEARYKLSQELLLYHMKVPEVDIQSLLTDRSPIPDFSGFDFIPRTVNDHMSIRMSLKMFDDLGLIKKFYIRRDKLARFILMVQKGYRDTPYHNWHHAFSVAHFAYALLMNLKLVEREILTPLQALSFLIAGFCHDLDHRGMSNSYQAHTGSALARLYSSEGSVNERHHLSQAICILNDSNSKILDGLTTVQFKECIDYLRELILDTDLANHFRKFKALQQLSSQNIYEPDNQILLMSLFITCCDLNDQIKSWRTVQHVADLIYAEFFAQGDLEKQMGRKVDAMMDRNKACIPELQIDFLQTVVRPTFEIMVQVFPETSSFLEQIDSNRAQWDNLVGVVCPRAPRV